MDKIIELNSESVYNYLTNHLNTTIEYGQMENICGLEHNPLNLQELTTVLNLTMMYNKLKNEPFLAALVINKKGLPGNGFFKTLEYLNVNVQDKINFHQEELQKVRNHKWQKFNWNK
jgi:hypothetical protein